MTDKSISYDELARLINMELEQSTQWAGSEWREAHKQALNYFLLRAKGDEVDGRSQVQAGDVADMIDHAHAEMQPMYAGPDLVEFLAESKGDEDRAALETKAVNWYWSERLRGFDKLDNSVQDGLLARTGYLKVWYEEGYGLPHIETLEGTREQIDASLAQLDEDADTQVLSEESIQPQVITEAALLGPDGVSAVGVTAEVQPEMLRAEVKVIPRLQEVKSEDVAPDDMFISRDATGSNMQQPRFVAQRRRMARQDVKALGFEAKQVDEIAYSETYHDDARTARKSDHNVYTRHAPHKSGQTIDIFECYYRVDMDGDGIPELVKAFYAKTNQLLRFEGNDEPEVELVRVRPFAAGSCLKVAHRHDGRSIFDKGKQVEDVKRALWRQMLDNTELGNNTGLIYGPGTDVDDLEDLSVVKFIYSRNPSEVRPIPYTSTSAQSLAALQYADKVGSERVGSSRQTSTEQVPVNQAAHTTERVMSAMERLVAMYARNLANTLIRDTFILLHQQLQLLPGKVAFESGDDWEETEPRRWVERSRIKVTLAPSEGERMRKSQALSVVIQNQREDAQSPYAVLSDLEAGYEARVDQARMMGLPDPSQYYVDPNSDKGREAVARAQQQAAQQAQMQARAQEALIQAQLAGVSMQEETKRLQATLDALEAQRDRLTKVTIEMSKLEAETGKEIPFGLVGEVPPEAMQG